jgi:hypothetical protein
MTQIIVAIPAMTDAMLSQSNRWSLMRATIAG